MEVVCPFQSSLKVISTKETFFELMKGFLGVKPPSFSEKTFIFLISSSNKSSIDITDFIRFCDRIHPSDPRNLLECIYSFWSPLWLLLFFLQDPLSFPSDLWFLSVCLKIYSEPNGKIRISDVDRVLRTIQSGFLHPAAQTILTSLASTIFSNQVVPSSFPLLKPSGFGNRFTTRERKYSQKWNKNNSLLYFALILFYSQRPRPCS